MVLKGTGSKQYSTGDSLLLPHLAWRLRVPFNHQLLICSLSKLKYNTFLTGYALWHILCKGASPHSTKENFLILHALGTELLRVGQQPQKPFSSCERLEIIMTQTLSPSSPEAAGLQEAVAGTSSDTCLLSAGFSWLLMLLQREVKAISTPFIPPAAQIKSSIFSD